MNKENIKIYFAPIEGITNCRYRNLHNKYFPGIDKYFVPFIKSSKGEMLNKERNDILPENNKINSLVVPQILSKNASDTVQIINELESLGYKEVNLNFGCPSATVVPKGKGGGILKDLNHLDEYLNEVFSNAKINISIKIRLGIEDENEFDNILPILNKYNIYELIIHPRTVIDYYTGPLHLNKLDNLDKKTNLNIIYNGDIRKLEDIEKIKQRFPFIKGIMIGRGLLTKPDLFSNNYKVIEFYNELIKENRKIFGINNSLFYEKQLWVYLKDNFNVSNDFVKKINKAKKDQDMDNIVNTIFNEYKARGK